jgi:hypothetical protein
MIPQELLELLPVESSTTCHCSLPLLPFEPLCQLQTSNLQPAPATRLRQQGRRILAWRSCNDLYPPDQLAMLRLTMVAWERGLTMGSRSCHAQLIGSIFSQLPRLSSDLFASYLKGAAVHLPGRLQWHVRPENHETGSSDGVVPPVRESFFGWGPYFADPSAHDHRAQVYSFWSQAGCLTSMWFLDLFCKRIHGGFQLLLLWAGLHGPPRPPQIMVAQMLPLRDVRDTQMLELIVNCNLPLEAYGLPLVRALVTAHCAKHAYFRITLRFLVSHRSARGAPKQYAPGYLSCPGLTWRVFKY